MDKISLVGQCVLIIKVGCLVSCKFILQEKVAVTRPISNTAGSEILEHVGVEDVAHHMLSGAQNLNGCCNITVLLCDCSFGIHQLTVKLD